jgi:hypothetical protein
VKGGKVVSVERGEHEGRERQEWRTEMKKARSGMQKKKVEKQLARCV